MTVEDAVEKVNKAIQEYCNALSVERGESGQMLDLAVVCYEVVGLDNDGVMQRRTDYFIPTDNFSLGQAIGIAEVAKQTMVFQIIKVHPCEGHD